MIGVTCLQARRLVLAEVDPLNADLGLERCRRCNSAEIRLQSALPYLDRRPHVLMGCQFCGWVSFVDQPKAYRR